MTMTPVTVLLTAAVALGCYLGWQYLKGQARKPGLTATHLLLGAGGLEQLAVGTQGFQADASGSSGATAAVLIGLAMLTGFLTPLFGRESRRRANTLLITHVSVAAAGFLLFLGWVSNR